MGYRGLRERGSSARARNGLAAGDRDGAADRFIRARGTGPGVLRNDELRPGSSARARNGPVDRGPSRNAGGFIRARAERARSACAGSPRKWVHPRARGTGLRSTFATDSTTGSSARARNGRDHGGWRALASGFIRARAERAITLWMPSWMAWVHPRARGTGRCTGPGRRRRRGSSARARNGLAEHLPHGGRRDHVRSPALRRPGRRTTWREIAASLRFSAATPASLVWSRITRRSASGSKRTPPVLAAVGHASPGSGDGTPADHLSSSCTDDRAAAGSINSGSAGGSGANHPAAVRPGWSNGRVSRWRCAMASFSCSVYAGSRSPRAASAPPPGSRRDRSPSRSTGPRTG